MIVLRDGRVATPQGLREMDIYVDGGTISALTEPGAPSEKAGSEREVFERVIDCDSSIILPGLIDVHVHLREPGASYKETVASGTAAAAAGGFTTVCAMPNLDPAPADAASLQQEVDIIRRDACVRVLPYGTITAAQSGRGALAAMAETAARVVAFSDDGRGVQEEATMRRAMQTARELGRMIVAHSEDERWPTTDPRSEYVQLERDLKLARETGCAYHVCHISTAASVRLVREAKRDGIDVSCETAPHYLLLCEDDVRDEGRFKMNPPLRTAADREALREGLADGTIDLIATDHAPHSRAEKCGSFADSLFGIVGLETAFPVLYTELVESGELTLPQLIERLSEAPARRFGLTGGWLREGGAADLTVLRPDAEYRIDPAGFLSKGRATPFAGRRVHGLITMTMCGGRIVYQHIRSEQCCSR
ncbi:MAG: dihydroorotase [Anaerovoracaceae bacterium]|jgi:dihydroorotase